MIAFKTIRARAEKRKGGPKALEKLLPAKPNVKALAKLSDDRFLAEMTGTNAPLPGSGATVAWSPDGKRIAFVSSVPGPETASATGDPIVITRYLYKPDAAEGVTHFNDNRRLHLFVVDVASGRIDQLTDGNHYEHSIDWSPNGQ